MLAEETKIINKQYDFAGETVVVQEKIVESKDNKTNNINEKNCESAVSTSSKTTTRPTIKRTAGGLSSLLSQLKRPKMSTLTKSLHDWNDYKKQTNLEDELNQHRRSKDSFIEKQAFLNRTDVREFEREKSIRDNERRMRQLNKPN